MPEDDNTTPQTPSGADTPPTTGGTTRRRATRKAAPPAADAPNDGAAPNDSAAAPVKAVKKATKRAAKKAAPAAQAGSTGTTDSTGSTDAAGSADAPSVPAKKATRRASKKAAPPAATDASAATDATEATGAPAQEAPVKAAKKATKRVAKKAAPAVQDPLPGGDAATGADPGTGATFLNGADADATAAPAKKATKRAAKKAPPAVAFVPPAATDETSGAAPADDTAPTPRKRVRKTAAQKAAEKAAEQPAASSEESQDSDTEDGADSEDGGSRRRRRGRRGRGRGKGTEDGAEQAETDESGDDGEAGRQAEDQGDPEDGEEGGSKRRRRRRRRSGSGDGDSGQQSAPSGGSSGRRDEVQSVRGSTRLEAKRQRRRDGRDNGRKRPPIVTEAEFLARRESVKREMAVRQVAERTQIAVLEDDVLVEHYVTKASSTSYAGNVYLGRVQNVLPSMEAAFIDIGKGRNAVLYAGEVNWDAAGLGGKPRRIEEALKSGQPVLVQVTKDPIGHKGARLTSQISLPGRFLVYVPEGNMTGISRRLPDTERKRLKDILKKIVPEDAGVIIRTAAEGASEEELTRDVQRLRAQWDVLKEKADSSSTSAPSLLYEEPDLAIRVVRDVFNEDFGRLVVAGDEGWEMVKAYVDHVAPDLADRLEHHTGESDLFADLRVDEQLTKALDRKVFLPSGGSLVIDRTEAMTVVDVNTGKFTGQGGNLEETVTRNNLEAAEEIVRQLRLRDVGGIIVVDFIDMVLEANRDLVLRRLTECLGRDRTKHQVAEVTSLGLVQMTRQRVGQGLLEAFSEPCEVCHGRGIIVHSEPVTPREQNGGSTGGGNGKQGESRRRRGKGGAAKAEEQPAGPARSNAELHRMHEAAVRRGTTDAEEPTDPGAEDPTGHSAGGPADAEPIDAPVAQDPAVQDDAVQQLADQSTEDEDLSDSADAADSTGYAGLLGGEDVTTEPAPRRRRRAASRPAGPPDGEGAEPQRVTAGG